MLNKKNFQEFIEIIKDTYKEINDISEKTNNSKSVIDSFLLNIEIQRFFIDKLLEKKEYKPYFWILKEQENFENNLSDIWEKLKKKTNDKYIKEKNITKNDISYYEKAKIIFKILSNKNLLAKDEYKKIYNLNNDDFYNVNLKQIKKFIDTLNKDFIPNKDMLDLKVTREDFEKYNKKEFLKSENPLFEYLKNPYARDNDFESYFEEKNNKLKKEYFERPDKEKDLKNKMKQLQTYKKLKYIYDYISNLSYLKLLALQYIFRFDKVLNSDKQNNKYLKYFLLFHFANDTNDFKKINFVFNRLVSNFYVEYFVGVSAFLLSIITIFLTNIFIGVFIILILSSYFGVKYLYNYFYNENIEIPIFIKVAISIALIYVIFGSNFQEIFFNKTSIEFVGDILGGSDN